MTSFTIEPSRIGRIVVPPNLPPKTALFYTTVDFDGRLNETTVAELMALVGERFGVTATLATCNQIHSANVATIKREKEWKECDSCDALWTADSGVALGIKVADCLPVTFVDPESGVFANIHSGWRGAAQNITAVTLDTASRSKTFDPKRSSAWLGPTIRVCCFEVGEEVVEQLAATFGDISPYVDRTRSKPHVDVAGITRQSLRNQGFADARIHDSGLCTRCEGSIFHSFRRDGRGGGRNLAIVAR